jgi:hypothetical protein
MIGGDRRFAQTAQRGHNGRQETMRTFMRSRLVPVLAAAAMLTAALPTPARADPASDFRRTQAFQERNWQNYLNEMPALDAKHPSRTSADLLALSVENGQLILHTPLASTPPGQEQKVKIDPSNDWSLLNVVGGAAGAGPVVPFNFILRTTEFAPDHTDTLMIQHVRNALLMIMRQSQSPSGMYLVQLQIQYPNAMQPGGGGDCRLTVIDQRHNRMSPAVTLISNGFSAFTREHPVEAEKYIRPLLHQFGQDAAMAPDPMLAFQVFSDQWTPDAAMITKVKTLVASLGSTDFHARTRAQHDLADLGKDAAVVLMQLDRTKLTPEQNARVDKVLAPYLPVDASAAAKLRTDPAFLVNCFYSDELIIRKAAFAQLESFTKLKLNFDPAAAPPTRTAAIPAVLKQLMDAKVIGTAP